MARWGIYCLANDNVLDWMLAFLRSLRTYNPAAQLIVIPFDHRIERLASLATTYDFTLLDEPDLLHRLDQVGKMLFPGRYRGEQMFRKYAAFYGPLQNFLFLDSDIVILAQLEPTMQRLLRARADLVFFDTSVEWVYGDVEFRRHMEANFGSRGFAAGAFVSRPGQVTIDDLSSLFGDWERLSKVFRRGVYDQPVLNYLFDVKRAKIVAASEIVPELSSGTWAGNPVDNRAKCLSRTGAPAVTRDGKVLPFLHWAGFRCDHRMPNIDFYLHFRLQAEPSWRNRMACRAQFRHW